MPLRPAPPRPRTDVQSVRPDEVPRSIAPGATPWAPPVARSRIGVYAALGATAGAVPVPWVPEALARRVRGALVHDVARRHGLTLSREARELLAEPTAPDVKGGTLLRALRYVGARVAVRAVAALAPVHAFWPVRSALRTFVLGHLFDRYLDVARTERGSQIDLEEARRVRRAIDGAILRAVTVVAEPPRPAPSGDDDRDTATAIVDLVLGVTAGIPERLIVRIEAAFDALLVEDHG